MRLIVLITAILIANIIHGMDEAQQPTKKRKCYIPRLEVDRDTTFIESRSGTWLKEIGDNVRPRQNADNFESRVHLLWYEPYKHYFLARFKLNDLEKSSTKKCYFDLHSKQIYAGDGIYCCRNTKKVNKLADEFGIELLENGKIKIKDPQAKYRIIPDDQLIIEGDQVKEK